MLSGKTVLLGVTGGIAAYKAAALASALVKQHCHVEVILTEHATQFITPLTFEQLTGNRAMVDTFDRNFSHQVEHIALARRTDLVLVAPATANVCAKLAHGLADDMLTTTILAPPSRKSSPNPNKANPAWSLWTESGPYGWTRYSKHRHIASYQSTKPTLSRSYPPQNTRQPSKPCPVPTNAQQAEPPWYSRN